MKSITSIVAPDGLVITRINECSGSVHQRTTSPKIHGLECHSIRSNPSCKLITKIPTRLLHEYQCRVSEAAILVSRSHGRTHARWRINHSVESAVTRQNESCEPFKHPLYWSDPSSNRVASRDCSARIKQKYSIRLHPTNMLSH